METKHQVHNLIILDESGSMDSIKKTIIQGFNEIVQTVKGIEANFPEQEHFISLVTFNGLGQKVLHFTDPVKKLKQIDDAKYQPDASTPLYDAMGFSFKMLRKVLEFKPDHNVLVTILTDGEENASKEYSGRDIKKMIEELKLNRWTFTYIGTDHDVEKFAASISITNTMVFQKDEENMKAMFVKEQSSRHAYSEKIRNKTNTNDNFYNNDNNPNSKA
jgi:Mg-chelatase subunit ChlD